MLDFQNFNFGGGLSSFGFSLSLPGLQIFLFAPIHLFILRPELPALFAYRRLCCGISDPVGKYLVPEYNIFSVTAPETREPVAPAVGIGNHDTGEFFREILCIRCKI